MWQVIVSCLSFKGRLLTLMEMHCIVDLTKLYPSLVTVCCVLFWIGGQIWVQVPLGVPSAFPQRLLQASQCTLHYTPACHICISILLHSLICCCLCPLVLQVCSLKFCCLCNVSRAILYTYISLLFL